MRKVLVVVLAVALLATALVAAGCGSSAPTSGSATAGGMTAAQILAKSQQAMTKVTSASFTGDMTIKVSSSGASAQAMLLGQAPIVLHVAGKAGDKTAGNDAVVAMTLQVAGQNLAMGMKTIGAKSWLGFQGTWYVVPATKRAGVKSTGAGSSSGKIAGSLGIDPQKWVASSTVAAEQLDGAAVYHVVTTADTTKVMDDLVKALNNPALSKAAGSDAAVLNQLKSSNSPLLKSLEKSLAAASVGYWIDAKTFVVRKGTLDAKLQFGSGSATQGVSGLRVSVTYTLGSFGQRVKVTPPAHAQPLKKLTNGLSGLSSGGGLAL